MEAKKEFDVIIVGGSYSGLSAAMALGRSLKTVLIIDSSKPCNRFTPHSHNFITQDGAKPADIASQAKAQVMKYPTISWLDELAVSARPTASGFEVTLASGEAYNAKKLHIATGIRDLLPEIPGMQECWGKTVVHCPFCHGYEIRNVKTGLLSNDEVAAHLAPMLKNWAPDLTIFTNGPAQLDPDQNEIIKQAQVAIDERLISRLEHEEGQLKRIHFEDGSSQPIAAMYHKPDFELHSDIPVQLDCELTEQGYIQVNPMQETTIPGVFASGDATNPMRSVAMAVSSGNMAGAAIVRALIFGL